MDRKYGLAKNRGPEVRGTCEQVPDFLWWTVKQPLTQRAAQRNDASFISSLTNKRSVYTIISHPAGLTERLSSCVISFRKAISLSVTTALNLRCSVSLRCLVLVRRFLSYSCTSNREGETSTPLLSAYRK